MSGPSSEHEVVVAMMRTRPQALARLVRSQLGFGRVARVAAVPATFSTPPAEYRADLALELATETIPRLIVLVEVQLTVQAQKQLSWPAYEAVARRRHRAPACVVVLTPDARVARWARRPIALGPSGSVFRAVVVGPREMPTRVEATAPPEIAILAALAHGRHARHGPRLVRAALRALAPLRLVDPATARLYFDLLAFKIKGPLQRALEEMMPEGQQFLSDWMREAEAKGIEKGLQQGIKKGIKKGIERGIEKGIEKGLVDGARRALRTILDARGIEITRADDERITSCQDIEKLESWTARAATASIGADVFGAPSRKAAKRR